MSAPGPCGICGAPVTPYAIHAGYRYWRCTGCRTSQLLPQPSRETLDEFYRTFHLAAADGGTYAEFDSRMQADFPCKSRRAMNFVRRPGARLLDVGCGKGFFVREALHAGFHAEGLDISTTGVEHAVTKLGLKARVGSLEAGAPEDLRSACDVITFWATIEHVPDPVRSLRAIRECLKPGGMLLLDTGLGDAPFEGLLMGHSQWYSAPEHLWVFSDQGLRIVLEKAGFEVVSVDRNFERSVLRRWVKWLRHAILCVLSCAALRPVLGGAGRDAMIEEAKWPIGRLISVVARRREAT